MIAFSGKMHWNFALLVWILIQCQIPDWINPIPFLIGSLFPDCDHKHAPIGRIFPMWLICKHRGFTHSLQGAIVFMLPVIYFINFKWGCIYVAGYLLHLVMDSGTPSGIRWIWKPKPKKLKRRTA